MGCCLRSTKDFLVGDRGLGALLVRPFADLEHLFVRVVLLPFWVVLSPRGNMLHPWVVGTFPLFLLDPCGLLGVRCPRLFHGFFEGDAVIGLILHHVIPPRNLNRLAFCVGHFSVVVSQVNFIA
jgi:hypothetical protein